MTQATPLAPEVAPKQLPPLRERKKRLFQKFRSDPLLWMERVLWVLDDAANTVRFVLNNVQREYFAELVRLYWKPWKTLADGTVIYRFQGIREINLKARQFGLSTLICAILLHDTIFFRNTKSQIFCQNLDKSKIMLKDKVKFFWRHIRPNELITLPKVVTNNDSVLEFATGSRFQADTPGMSEDQASGKGRSITFRNALLSEVSEWEDAETLWQGLLPAVGNPTTNIFWESSPKNRKSGPFFRSMYDEGKRQGAKFRSRFWAWFKYEKYQTPFESADEREAFVHSLSDDELALQKEHWLSLEQLYWRRTKISEFGGGEKGLRKFKSDYPSTENEGFEASRDDLFFKDTEVNVCRVLAKPAEPIAGRAYSITVDPAEGKGGDFFVVKVVDPITRAQVYQFSSNTYRLRRQHWKIYEIFLRYPGLVSIENNGIGKTVVYLARLIKDVFFQKSLYVSAKGQDGFYTGASKNTWMEELRNEYELAAQAYADLGPDDPEPDVPIGYRSCYPESIQEMEYFEEKEDGSLGAQDGKHDDHLLADMIQVQQLKRIGRYLKRYEKYYPDREKTRVPIGWSDDGDDTPEPL